MSRQFDAKQYALTARTRCDGVELFLNYLNISEDEFEYSEGMTAEEYIYGKSEIETPAEEQPSDKHH